MPADALWGAQTARAVENFPISGLPVPPAVVHALALIKAAAAGVNAALGRAGRRARGRHRGGGRARSPPASTTTQFPIDVFQTGSGTSTNMNVNEVVARLAHLAAPASTSTPTTTSTPASPATTPSPRAICAWRRPWRCASELAPALAHLETSLGPRRPSSPSVVKAGRTHLMDAVPVTLGQEFGGYAAPGRAGPCSACCTPPQAAAELPLGGTAAGTGLNAAPGFAARGDRRVRERTGVRVPRGREPLRGPVGPGRRSSSSAAPLKVVAVSLTKICNDLRWMCSGPRAGLGEIHLPDLQPGSSIMPGKVNPVVLRGHADGVRAGDRQRRDHHHRPAPAGSFELNVMLPVMAEQRAGVGWRCSRQRAGCWPTAASTASRPTPSAAASWPRARRRSSPR